MPPGGEPKAREFYTGILQIAETPKPPDMAKRGGCWFEDENVRIHLGVEADFRAARKAHPGLLVNDIDALVAVLRERRYEPREGELVHGRRRYFVDDPFGNRIELIAA
jgi:catechol 2,3-dioxygenase-like lactoylglutathione lyase family enzyme